jgi:hypothetical protein
VGTNGLLARPPEQPLGAGVPRGYPSMVIQGKDRVIG